MQNISVTLAHHEEVEVGFYVFESISHLTQNGHARIGRLTPLSHWDHVAWHSFLMHRLVLDDLASLCAQT
jgi:hypothetical protein